MPLGRLLLVFVSIAHRVAFNGPNPVMFSNGDARKANVQQPIFSNLLGSSQSDRLLQFPEGFFSLYLLQVDRACSVEYPSNDVSNDSHLAS